MIILEKSSNPFFSIVIPVFNREKTLARAILSVLNQSFKDFELIIVLDGPTDNTEDIANDFLSDSRVNIVKLDSNHGVSFARNKGIEIARSSWICFLDSDDEWLLDKLQKQYDYIQEHPETVLLHGDEIWIRDGVRVNQMKKHKKGGGDQFIASLKLCLISPSCVCLRKKLLSEFNGFQEDYIVCEDYDLWLKICAHYEIDFIDDFLIKKYGGHEDQLSRKYHSMDYYRIKSIDHCLKKFDLTEIQKESAIKILTKKCKILLKGYIKHQNMKNYGEIENILAQYT